MIRIGREIQCLPYAGFLLRVFKVMLKPNMQFLNLPLMQICKAHGPAGVFGIFQFGITKLYLLSSLGYLLSCIKVKICYLINLSTV